MKIELCYTENNQLWKMEKIAADHGYTKTEECYWVQIFTNENGDTIVTTRENGELSHDPAEKLIAMLEQEPAPVEPLEPIGFVQAKRDPDGGFTCYEYRPITGWAKYARFQTIEEADADARQRAIDSFGLLTHKAPEQEPETTETRQERTDRENRDHCRRIAETLEAYARGTMYRCPECGETFELQTTGYDEETDTYTLPCGCTVDEEPEQLGLYDYFDDVLDIEYRIESDRKTVRSVSLMVAFGGPTIYIDTAENAVLLYWWTDRARYSFDSWIGDQINEWAQELWDIGQ